MSEEAKRERSKRPRQSRPRANTTTATSREIQNQRQQQRPAPVHGQSRPSIGFAQPQLPHLSDHASSGRGSLSFSGSMTPASSIGSDIFMAGTSLPMNSGQYGMTQQPTALLQDPLMPPPPLQMMAPNPYMGTPLDGSIADECMEWAQYSSTAMLAAAPMRGTDQMLELVPNMVEPSSLHCLSQAITVSLRDPPAAAPEAGKADVALTLTAPNGSTMAADTSAGYYGATAPGNVSNLVHAFRQNTLEESTTPLPVVRRMLRVQTNSGHVQEVRV